MATRAPIVLTTGEPAGVGPEIALRGVADDAAGPCVLLGDADLLGATARRIGVRWPLAPRVVVEHVALRVPCEPGRLAPRNGPYVLELLDRAIAGCVAGRYAAMVTAPIHKGAINDGLGAGAPLFTGHTEYLAHATSSRHVVMLLVGGGLRVALATTHLPLAAVPAAITGAGLAATLDGLHRGLREFFGLPAPRIAVLGLNPHAGENGYLGREDVDVIAPAVEAARARGVGAEGPLPADTVFVPSIARRFDAILAMYHDQGLAPLKQASFGHGVNVTLGLPLVRTSVDHGTALDLAGRGTADPGSLRAALALARDIVARREASGVAH
ncbi:MAG TPA: 4-hydroxythreonine-4-phosphate dehydrogenase PdxA [Burkholderiaceae bacterium]|nr:4-hydroxythreonine-4-phosphate dehydrogenase PdxA [Burkholderiaceae bacterium]